MSTKKYHCGLIPPYSAATMMSSKSKKLMTKTNRSQAGILNMVSNISNVVGYSNVLPFLENDARNMTSGSNSIVKRNKDTAYSRKHCSIIDGNIPAKANVLGEDKNKHNNNNNNTIINHNNNNNKKSRTNDVDNVENENANENGDIDDEADAYVDAEETDSLASMETLSDNVAIWVDGERHWISGVDANTTCTDLICALLNYQNGQQMFNHDTIDHHGQDNLNDYHDMNTSTSINENPNNNCNIGGNNAINQSMPNKEGKQESAQTAVNQNISNNTKATILLLEQQRRNSIPYASEYVIVRQHRHCEEYLDGNTKVFDVLPTKLEGVTNNGGGIASIGGIGGIGASNRKECELFLRRLVSSTAVSGSFEGHAGTPSPQHAGNTQVASLLSTDKDSGMGSPVGSSRSARFRRRKYKSATWFSQSNTLHPKATQRSGNGGYSSAAAAATTSSDNIANERLMRIILAQDETIHRQLSLLREKERQISKIEEEKHRVREREMGKNYLLETYFKGLDETACEQNEENEADQEIFIDEPPCQHITETVEKPAATTGNSQHRSSRHNKEHSNAHQEFRQQQRSNQLGNNTSSDAVKVNNSVAADANDNGAAVSAATLMAAANGFVGEFGSQKDIELQIFWLEKIYALNKQLQREEETLLKLHAKIRKHQVRCAYQLKNDVLIQIDELDAKLALQCADICRIEDNLIISDEQLKGKLNLVEKLNTELQEIKVVNAMSTENNIIKNCDLQDKTFNTKADINVEVIQLETKSRKRKPIVGEFVEPNVIDACTSKPTKPSKHQSSCNSNTQISCTNDDYANDNDDDDDEYERNELQNMNVKVNDDNVENITTAVVSPMTKLALSTSAIYSTTLNQHQHLHQPKQNSNELMQQQKQHQKQLKIPLHNYPISRVNQFEQSSAIATAMNTNVNAIAIATTTPQALIDKNMLPQHAPNVKIIIKPMYEALSLNQMTSTTIPTTTTTTTTKPTTVSTLTSNAVTCQQQLSDSISTIQNSSTKVPLKETTEYSIDLSQLGTLV